MSADMLCHETRCEGRTAWFVILEKVSSCVRCHFDGDHGVNSRQDFMLRSQIVSLTHMARQSRHVLQTLSPEGLLSDRSHGPRWSILPNSCNNIAAAAAYGSVNRPSIPPMMVIRYKPSRLTFPCCLCHRSSAEVVRINSMLAFRR